MNGLDEVIFNSGIGENDVLARQLICADLDFLDITFDEEKNILKTSMIRKIQKDDTPVKTLIIPIDEECQIVLDLFDTLGLEWLRWRAV